MNLRIPLTAEKFPDQLSDCQFLKDSAPWSWLHRKTEILEYCIESLSVNSVFYLECFTA